MRPACLPAAKGLDRRGRAADSARLVKSAWRKRLFAAVLVGLVIAIWRLQPAPPRTGADLFPPDTPVCLIIADLPGALKRWTASPAGSMNLISHTNSAVATMWEEVPRWFRDLMPLVTRGVEQFGDGEVILALTGLQTTPTIAPQLALGVQLGARRAAAKTWREELRGLLRREFPKAAAEKQRFHGRDYERWQPHPGLELCVAELEDYLALTLGSAPMLEMIERAAKPARDALAGSEGFRAARYRLPPRRDVMLAVQGGPFAVKLDPLLRWLPQLRMAGEPFGGARMVAWAQSVGTNGVRELLVVARAAGATRLPEAVEPALLGRLPASCATAAVFYGEPREVYQRLMRMVVNLGLRQWVKSVTLMEVGWSVAGLDFPEDMLGCLGGGCIVAWDWPAEVKWPQLFFGAEVRDRKRLANATDRLAASPRAAPLRWREMDGWLWMSSSADALDRVARAAAGTVPSLRNDPQWSRQLEELPRRGCAWVYANPARLADTGKEATARLTPLAACVSSFGNHSTVTSSSSLGMITTAWLAVERLMAEQTAK